MGKGKGPRKRRDSISNQPSESEKDTERQTQEKADLVPPARRPPTAIGAGTPPPPPDEPLRPRSEEHTSELQSPYDLVCRLLLEKKKITKEALLGVSDPQKNRYT